MHAPYLHPHIIEDIGFKHPLVCTSWSLHGHLMDILCILGIVGILSIVESIYYVVS